MEEQEEEEDQDQQRPSPSSSSSSSTDLTRPHLRREPSFSRWCGDVVPTYAYGLGHSPTNSFDALSIDVDDPHAFALPLLHHSSAAAAAETESQSYFRQRSTVADLKDRAAAIPAFDIEAGSSSLHPSESRAKLDSLELSAHLHHHHLHLSSSSDPAAVFKTAFCIVVWYTISTCLTL